MNRKLPLLLFALLAAVAVLPGLSFAGSPSTIPSGILNWTEVNITNSQSGATGANFQQMSNITLSSFSGYIKYNANFANFEYFYANGTIIPAWIESNSSGKLITWVHLNPSISGSSTYAIYLGFASQSTNELSSSGTSGIGEAPQLSSTYGAYDNGKKVFLYYDGFEGNTLNSTWTNYGTMSLKVNNGLNMSYLYTKSSCQYGIVGTTIDSTVPYMMWASIPQNLECNSSYCYADRGIVGISTGTTVGSASSSHFIYPSYFAGKAGDNAGGTFYSASGARSTLYSLSIAPTMLIGMGFTGAQTLSYFQNTTIPAQWHTISDSNVSFSSTNYGFIGTDACGVTGQTAWENFTYVMATLYPPSGTMPSVSFSAVQSVPTVLTISVSPSSATIDNGQSITLTGTASRGTPSYTYQWYSNSGCTTTISGATSANYDASPTSTTTYCVKVTDSLSATNTSTSTITVNSALGTPTLSPSTTQTLDNGQSVSISTSWSGGTSTYTAKLYSGTSSSCASDTTLVQTVSSATSPQSFTSQSPTSSLYYCSKITDSAYSPVTTSSATTHVIVNSALSAGSPTPSNPTIDSGQSVTLTANPSGGTTSYSYQWYSGTSSTCTSDTTALGTSSTQSVSPTSSTYYCYKVTDSATTPVSAYSSTTHVSVNTALSIPSMATLATQLDDGQSTTLTLSWSGGTSTFTAEIYNVTGSSSLYSSSSATSPFSTSVSARGTGTFTYNGFVTDSAYSPVTKNSTKVSFTVHTALSAGTPTASNTVIDSGQVSLITSNPSGGWTSYSYQWYTGASCTSPIGGATSSTYLASPTSTTTYYYKVTDSASTPTSACSGGVTVTVNSALGSASISPTSATYNTGQSISIAASISGGTTPYAYQWYNDTSGSGVSMSGKTSTPLTLTAGAAQTVKYYVIVSDSASTPAVSQSSTGTYVVNTALATPTITPSSPTFDSGQSTTLTGSSGSGGTSPYSYAWYSGSCSGTVLSTSTTYAPSSAGTYYFKVTDSASTPVSQCSSGDVVTINSALSPTSISSPTGSVTLDAASQSQTVTVTAPTTGTSPYSYSWAVTAGKSCPGFSSPGSVTTFTYSPSSSSADCRFTVTVQDSATTPESYTANTPQMTVYSQLAAGAPTASNSIVNPVVTSTTLTANPSGGLTPYSYQWYKGSSSTCASDSSIGGATSNTYTDSPVVNTYYCYKLTDSATTPNVLYSGTTLVQYSSIVTEPFYLLNVSNTGVLGTLSISSNVIKNTYYPYEIKANYSASNFTYTLTLARNGTANTLFSNVSSFAYVPPSNDVNAGFLCSNNAKGGNCIGNVTYTTSTTLTSSLSVSGSITINSGVILTTNGFSLIAGNTVTWTGATILAGNSPLTPGSGASPGTAGQSILSSYGGSGGGGGYCGSLGCGSIVAGGNGGNTIAVGGTGGTSSGGSPTAGSTPSSPTLTSNMISSWVANGIQKYLEGAPGGGGADSNGGKGGNSSYGVLIEANAIVAGTTVTNGIAGSSASNQRGGGGGGGAGSVLFVYGASYSAGTVYYTGGTGGADGGYSGAAGGNGNTMTYQYSGSPPIGYTTPYVYTLTEFANGNSVAQFSLTLGVNMTSIPSALTFNSFNGTCIQYLPCLASATFTAKPTSWKIVTANQPLTNQHSNTSIGEQFDSPNIDIANFPSDITLTYSQFTPSVSFTINSINNPNVQGSLTQTAWNTIASNTIPSAPYTRRIANISTYDQNNLHPLSANSSYSYSMMLNGYLLNGQIAYTANSFGVFIANSLYLNPAADMSNLTVISSAASHFISQNNYCPVSLPNGTYSTFYPYLVDANGSLYTFDIYSGGGYGGQQDWMITQKQVGGSYTQVNQFHVNTVPFAMPLESNGAAYRFLFRNQSCGQIFYSSPAITWVSPISIYLPTNITVPVLSTWNVTAACHTYVSSNQTYINCGGVDHFGNVKNWTIQVRNVTNILGSFTTIAEYNATGSTFNYTYPVSNKSSQLAVIGLATLNNATQVQVLNYQYNSGTYIPPLPAGGAILAVLLLFTLIFAGATSKSVMMVTLDLALFVGNVLGIIPLSTLAFWGIVVTSAVLIILFESDKI